MTTDTEHTDWDYEIATEGCVPLSLQDRDEIAGYLDLLADLDDGEGNVDGDRIRALAESVRRRSPQEEIAARASNLPAIGARVRLVHDVDRYPHFMAIAGSEGVVVHRPGGDPSGTFCVRMDEEIAGAEDWENQIVWSPCDGDDPMRDLQVIA